MKDLSEDLISHESAWDIYRVVYDRDTLVVDEEATRRARGEERAARLKRGRPYKEFVKEWTKPEPPADIPYYGSWDDVSVVYAGVGATRQKMPASNIAEVFMPDPKDLRIAALEARIEALQRERSAPGGKTETR